MAGTLPKKVVLRKPRIKKPMLTKEEVQNQIKQQEIPIQEERENQKQSDSSIQENEITKPLIKNFDEKDKEEDILIDIPDQNAEKIIQPKTKRTLLIKKEPVKQIEISKSISKSIPKLIPKLESFDDKFIDNLHIRSRITKDTVTLAKLKRPKENLPRIKKPKPKRRITMLTIASLILSIVMIMWTYMVINDYLLNRLDGSLASFIYIIAMVLFTAILCIWFIIEMIMGDA
jgi:hypothetical protein